jgi:hypothetical protein
MAAPVASALDVAQSHALRRLAAAAPENRRAQMLALADGYAARTESRAAALPLTAYAGTYGERTVSLNGDQLYYQRGGGMRQRLIALGGNRFAFEEDPGFIFTFVPTGTQVAAMEMGPAGAPPQGRYDRSAATATASVPVAR